MSVYHMATFVSTPALGQGTFIRRPRNAICECVSQKRHFPTAKSRSAKPINIHMSNSPQNDLMRGPDPSEISSTRGFALQDAPVHDFMDLRLQSEAFSKGGAYAIRNQGGEICYMGYSKNIAAKLQFHARLVPEECASFQVYVPPVPAELISPEMLENVLEYWVRENGGVPKGNTADRGRWEREESEQRKTRQNERQDPYAQDLKDIPVRERRTAQRVPHHRRSSTSYEGDAFADNFRSSSGTRRRRRSEDGWNASDDDYVEVEVDPLDPFSASKRRERKSWDFESDDDENEEDWVPIVALMGCAGLIWLLGMLSNTLPAASPSLGM